MYGTSLESASNPEIPTRTNPNRESDIDFQLSIRNGKLGLQSRSSRAARQVTVRGRRREESGQPAAIFLATFGVAREVANDG